MQPVKYWTKDRHLLVGCWWSLLIPACRYTMESLDGRSTNQLKQNELANAMSFIQSYKYWWVQCSRQYSCWILGLIDNRCRVILAVRPLHIHLIYRERNGIEPLSWLEWRGRLAPETGSWTTVVWFLFWSWCTGIAMTISWGFPLTMVYCQKENFGTNPIVQAFGESNVALRFRVQIGDP